MSRTCHVKDRELAERGLSEADLIGDDPDEVPEMPPGELCNAKTRDEGTFDGYCRAISGQGTENEEGRCKHHGGCAGPPEGNQNATTHALQADPKHYAGNLPHEEQEWVRDMAASIEDRIRANTGSVDLLDRTLARRLAIRMHIASNASEYIQEQGMIETIWTDEGRQDVKNRLLEELRQYDQGIVMDLKRIGVLDDPESQTADALEQWTEFIEKGH